MSVIKGIKIGERVGKNNLFAERHGNTYILRRLARSDAGPRPVVVGKVTSSGGKYISINTSGVMLAVSKTQIEAMETFL